MNKIKTFIHSLQNSLTNLNYYQKVKDVPLSFSLKYLYVLLVLVSLLTVIPSMVGLILLVPKIPEIRTKVESVVGDAYPKNLVITLKNGQLSTNVHEPYYYDGPKEVADSLKDSETNTKQHLVAIDTKAAVDDYPKYNSYVLITKSAAVYPRNSQTEITFFKPDQNFKLNQSIYKQFVSKLKPYLGMIEPLIIILAVLTLVIGPFLLSAFALVGKLISLFFYALIAWGISKLFKLSLNFSQTYKICLHASTLPIILFSLLTIIISVPFAYSLVLIVFLIIIFNHMKSSPK